jgi:hypothetical protein
MKIGRAGSGNGRGEVDEQLPGDAELLDEAEPEPDELEVEPEDDVEGTESASLPGDGERGDGLGRQVARRPEQPSRKKSTRSQRRRKPGKKR